MAEKNKSRDAAKHAPPVPKMRDQSETEGRIGEGKNAGVRNVVAGGTQRSEASDRARGSGGRNSDMRVGAKGLAKKCATILTVPGRAPYKTPFALPLLHQHSQHDRTRRYAPVKRVLRNA